TTPTPSAREWVFMLRTCPPAPWKPGDRWSLRSSGWSSSDGKVQTSQLTSIPNRGIIIFVMAERAYVPVGKTAARAAAILDELLRDYPGRDFAVELWDGTQWEPQAGTFCRFTWHINNPTVL